MSAMEFFAELLFEILGEAIIEVIVAVLARPAEAESLERHD